LLIGFVQLLVKASIWSIPDDEEEEDKARLKFISTSNRTPELATNELMNATAHFGSVVSEMNIFSKDLLNSTDLKAINKLLDRIKKYEKIADRIEAEITEYISKLSDTEITQLTSNRLRNILNICHDLERTADLYYQISLLLLEKSEKRVYFLPYQRNNLNALFDLLNEALHVMKVNLSVPDYKTVDPQSAAAVETNINEMIIKIRSQILDGINQDGYTANSTIVYNDIFNLLEKIGDQIFSVTKSIIIDK
jgi:phosphate:Na+ symporter